MSLTLGDLRKSVSAETVNDVLDAQPIVDNVLALLDHWTEKGKLQRVQFEEELREDIPAIINDMLQEIVLGD